MEGMERILGRIDQDAQAQVDAILQEADGRVAAITARDQAAAQREAEAILARGTQEAQRRKSQIEGIARLDTGKDKLAVKQELVNRVFAETLERLCSLPQAEYIKLLAGLAASGARTGSEAVVLNPTDRDKVGKAVVTAANENLKAAGRAGNLVLSDRTADIQGGVMLSEGSVDVNCALETMLDLMRETHSVKVAKELFG